MTTWPRTVPYDEQPIQLPPFLPIDSRLYSAQLFPTSLLDSLESLDEENTLYCEAQWNTAHQALLSSTQELDSRGNRTMHLPELSPRNYVMRSILLQDIEYQTRREVLKSSALYDVPVTPIPVQSNYGPARAVLFTLSTPHIRENYPPVSIHDTVWLRQLIPRSNSLQRLVLEARIHSIQKTMGTVILQCDALAVDDMLQSGRFNVEFVPQARQFTLCRKALESMHRSIETGEHAIDGMVPSSRPWPARWLFPEPTDWDETTPTSRERPLLRWIDPELNEEQKVVVRSLLCIDFL